MAIITFALAPVRPRCRGALDLLELRMKPVPLLQCGHMQLQQYLVLLADLFVVTSQAVQLWIR